MPKIWIDLDDEIEELGQSDEYFYINLGIKTIDPRKIVALSRELDRNKLNALREKIRQNGWQDIMPSTLSLLLMPNGTYAVDSGGNHRAVASNEFGIKTIQADVGTYMIKSLLTNEELSTIEEKERMRTNIFRQHKKERNEERRFNLFHESQIISESIDEIKLGAYYRAINE